MDVREKLVELLQDCVCDYVSTENYDWWVTYEVKYKELADHLIANGVIISKTETVATDNNVGHKWISVKDRLPDTECLAVSMLTGPAYKEMLVGYVAEASNWDTGYECESDGEILPNVTHWMPLPQPPKGE